MQKIIDLLIYGGLSPKVFQAITDDVSESNRKSVVTYSAISLAGFIAIYLYAALGNNPVSRNAISYLVGIVLMLILLVLNLTVAKKKPIIIRLSAYLFVFAILGIGIMLAAAAREDVTASFMVFLFVAPLLFTIRPLYIDLIVLGCDVTYILLMQQIQTPDLFRKNIVNACIYGVLSMFICTAMTRMRLQKFETDHTNRILMETDQLTGMLNRHSYMQHINALKETGSMAGIKVCAFDVNGLKKLNDRVGHHAGDELLRGAAACLETVFSRYGRCYRIGGDEFVAILQAGSPDMEELKKMLDDQTGRFKSTCITKISISTGIVEGTEQDNIEDLLRRADARMYEDKASYYEAMKH